MLKKKTKKHNNTNGTYRSIIIRSVTYSTRTYNPVPNTLKKIRNQVNLCKTGKH